MKKSLLLLMVVLLTFALVAIAFGIPINNVTGTKHNLSSAGGGSYKAIAGNEDQICVFCHTPHQAEGFSTDPLWNHSNSTHAGTYNVYSSTTLNATVGAGAIAAILGNGTALSNLCMSCHDGTQAINSLYNPSNDLGGNPTMTAFGDTITTNANIGTDLSNDHPVNFTYDDALAQADGGLVLPSSATSACYDGGTSNYAVSIGQFQSDYAGSSLAQKLVPGNQFQCSSCHGAHIYYGGTQSGYSPFLKVNNVGSGLCLSCHCK